MSKNSLKPLHFTIVGSLNPTLQALSKDDKPILIIVNMQLIALSSILISIPSTLVHKKRDGYIDKTGFIRFDASWWYRDGGGGEVKIRIEKKTTVLLPPHVHHLSTREEKGHILSLNFKVCKAQDPKAIQIIWAGSDWDGRICVFLSKDDKIFWLSTSWKWWSPCVINTIYSCGPFAQYHN